VPAAAVGAAARRMREAGRMALLFGRGVLEHPKAAELVQAIENLAWALESMVAGEIVNQITVPEETAIWARVALDRMLEIK